MCIMKIFWHCEPLLHFMKSFHLKLQTQLSNHNCYYSKVKSFYFWFPMISFWSSKNQTPNPRNRRREERWWMYMKFHIFLKFDIFLTFYFLVKIYIFVNFDLFVKFDFFIKSDSFIKLYVATNIIFKFDNFIKSS